MFRVLLADDQPVILTGIEVALRSQYEITRAVGDGRALVEAARRLRPDVIILEKALPLLGGLEAARQIKDELPAVKVLFFSSYVTPQFVTSARRAGASGVVSKGAPLSELRRALEVILNRGTQWPSFQREAECDVSEAPPHQDASSLSVRELEVLQCIARGSAAKQIAFQLSISAWTVAFHRRQIKMKLGLNSTAELTRYAIQIGLISLAAKPKSDTESTQPENRTVAAAHGGASGF